MITNIIDRREKPYRWKKINAIVEATWHDNTCKDADQSMAEPMGPAYEELEHRPLEEAIIWAEKFDGEVTLYLYDWDSGIYTYEERARLRGVEVLP